jgi:hypothetical protein
MSIVGGVDIHRKQITFDYVEVETGRLERGRITPADREHLAGWGVPLRPGERGGVRAGGVYWVAVRGGRDAGGRRGRTWPSRPTPPRCADPSGGRRRTRPTRSCCGSCWPPGGCRSATSHPRGCWSGGRCWSSTTTCAPSTPAGPSAFVQPRVMAASRLGDERGVREQSGESATTRGGAARSSSPASTWTGAPNVASAAQVAIGSKGPSAPKAAATSAFRR